MGSSIGFSNNYCHDQLNQQIVNLAYGGGINFSTASAYFGLFFEDDYDDTATQPYVGSLKLHHLIDQENTDIVDTGCTWHEASLSGIFVSDTFVTASWTDLLGSQY